MLFDQPERRPTAPTVLNTTSLVPLERHRSAVRWQFARGVLIGVLVSAAATVPFFRYSKMRPEETSLQKGSGQTVPGHPDIPAALPKPREATAGPFPLAIQPKPQSPKQPKHSEDPASE
jgi:cell division protein FtsN